MKEVHSNSFPSGQAATPGSRRAPRGSEISCKGWRQEAVLRLLMNSRDPEVSGNADRGPDVRSILPVLPSVADDQTLIAINGNPPLVLPSDESAPRVIQYLDAATAFNDEESTGHALWLGRSEDQSWTSAGGQSALCAAFMLLAYAGKKLFGADLAGKLVVTGGMGAMGRATSLAASMNGAGFLGIEVDERVIQSCIRSGHCDICVNDLDEALRILKVAIRQKQPVAVGLAGNCSKILPEMARRGVLPDLLTDTTGSADAAEESRARHVAAIFELQKMGAVVFELGEGVISRSRRAGRAQPSANPDFFSEFLGSVVSDGAVPVSWFALSGERSDLFRLDEALMELVPEDAMLARWLRMATKFVRIQGLPARVAWLGAAVRERWALRFNGLVCSNEFKAPVVLCRDYSLDDRPPKPMLDMANEEGDFAFARRLLDAARNAAAGAALAVLERRGDQVYFLSQTVVADGSPQAAQALAELLNIPSR